MKTHSLQALVILSVFAFVQYGKAQDQPSAANTALAEELISVMHLENNYASTFDKIKQLQGNMAGKIFNSTVTNAPPSLDASLQNARNTMTNSMNASMNAAASFMNWEKMKPVLVSVYASMFTAQELQGAIDFYKTPIGQKWVEKQPQVSMVIMSKTMEMAMASQQPMMDQLKKSMDALKALQMNTNALPSTTSPVPAASTPVSTH